MRTLLAIALLALGTHAAAAPVAEPVSWTHGGTTFDGTTEAAIFPGDLPKDAQKALDGSLEGSLKFVRFRPPPPKDGTWPAIRLDRAMEFLLGDRFQ